MTEHEKQFVQKRSTRDHAHVIGAGVDPRAFAAADGGDIRRRYGVGDAPLVGFVGRLTTPKGVLTLLHAMTRVWAEAPNARLLLAGAAPAHAGHARDEVTEALAALPAVDRARVIVVRDFSDAEKASLFDALDVFAMPSIAESFGISYKSQAWMRKKAVIGSRIGSMQCVIDEGVDGRSSNKATPKTSGRAILCLLSNPELRDQMGSRGYAKTMANFTWDRITEKVEGIYRAAMLVATRRAA